LLFLIKKWQHLFDFLFYGHFHAHKYNTNYFKCQGYLLTVPKHNHFKRLAPLLVTILILLVIILGYWGYRINGLRKTTDPFSVLYDTILMFKMESYESGVYNWQLVVARYLATLIVGYGAYVLVIGYFSKLWFRFKIILTYRDHTIIAGLGLKGYLLAIDLHNAGQKVVVIESNPESIYIERVCKEGIIIFISDGLDKNCWINAGLLLAKRFILVMDSDDKNIETARFISVLCSRRHENNPVTCLMHLDNLNNFNLLKDYLDIHYGKTKLDITTFNTFQLAAQRIWDLYPPHNTEKENPSGSEITILISGYNETAEAFLVENMILSRYKDLVNIRVFIVVPNPEQVEMELKDKYPFMTKYLNYQVISQNDNFFYNEHYIGDEDFKKLRMVYVFGDEDAEVVLRAKKLKQCFYNRNNTTGKGESSPEDALLYDRMLKEPRVIVCLPEKTSVVELLNYMRSTISNASERIADETLEQKPLEERLSGYLNIIFFRQFTESYNKSYLIDQNEMITVIAKVINYLYAIKYDFSARLKWLFDEAKIQYDPNLLKEITGDFEKTLLTINLTTNDPIREIEDAVFKKISTAFNLPLNFSLAILSIQYRWQLLSARLEDSNMYSARHSQIKLLYPHETDSDFSVLAPMEHTRWMAEKLAFQFRFGHVPKKKPMKNIVKEELKLSNLIVPFDEIPEDEKDKDFDPYRLLRVIRQITDNFKH